MIWEKERDKLYPQTSKFQDFGHTEQISRNERCKILQKYNSTCRYCGGKYQKYLMCTYIPNTRSNDICCRACYIITHLNSGLFDEIKIYYSTMSQVEIVRETINYIINNNEIPHPIDIDKNIKKVPISVLEYINIINNHENLSKKASDTCPIELKNFKIFFSKNFDINFIINNYGHEMMIIVDDDDKKDKKKIKNNIPDYQLTKDFLVKYF